MGSKAVVAVTAAILLSLLVLVTIPLSAEEREYEKLAELRHPVLVKFCQDPYQKECFREVLEGEISQCFEENAIEMERAKLTRAEALRFCRTSVWRQADWPGNE